MRQRTAASGASQRRRTRLLTKEAPSASNTIRKRKMNLHAIPTAMCFAKVCRALCLSLVAALSLVSFGPVAAEDDRGQGAHRNSLTGNWYLNVPAGPGQVALTALQTYFADGNLMEESNSMAIRSLGHGFWRPIGHRRFIQGFLTFRFDGPSRNFTGRSERLATLELSEDGQTFTNLGQTLNVYDASGNLVSSTPQSSSVVAVRFSESHPFIAAP
jgi:hypothetical protein